jgi:membrane protein
VRRIVSVFHAPLVLMTVAVAGLVFERAAVEDRFVSEVRGLVGHEGGEVVETVLRSVRNREKDTLSLVIGMLVLLWGAAAVFGELQDALNRIWKVDVTSRRSALSTLIPEGMFSLAMALSVAFLLLVSLLVHAGLSAVRDSAHGWLGDAPAVLHALSTPVSLVVTALLACSGGWARRSVTLQA